MTEIDATAGATADGTADATADATTDDELLAVPAAALRPSLEAVLMVADQPLDATVLALAPAPTTGLVLEAATGEFFARGAGADLRLRGIAAGLRGSADAYTAADELLAAAVGAVLLARRRPGGVPEGPRVLSVKDLVSSAGTGSMTEGTRGTLAARGISGLGDMLKAHADRAPLKRNVEADEVGDTALFLASDLSSAITGETIYVDCGYNIMAF